MYYIQQMGFFDGIGNWIKNTAQNIGSGIKNVAETIGTGAKNVASFIGEKVKPIIPVVGQVARTIGDVAGAVKDFVPGAGWVAKGANWVADKVDDGSAMKLADKLQRVGQDVGSRADQVQTKVNQVQGDVTNTVNKLQTGLGKR
jgi:hypothetical protein